MFTKNMFIRATLAATAIAVVPSAALASSHREAPMTSEDPTIDATDLYTFRNGTNVVIVANYIPMELPAGGPNFHRFSDSAVYRINIDNSGDARADIVYEFRFRTTVRDPNTFLYNNGPINSTAMSGLNVRQLMTVTRTVGGTATVLATDREVAPAYVGRHSYTTPTVMPMASSAAGDTAYDTYVTSNNIHTLSGGGQVFAGPRDDPFFVDLGAVFDLLRIRPGPPGNAGGGVDYVSGYNVHSIVIEVPITLLSMGGTVPTDPALASSIIGVWTTAHRPRVSVLRGSIRETHGQLVQVSRLGNPLVNETLVPLGFKDFFNSSLPQDDVANYGAALTNNEVSRLLNALYGLGINVPNVFSMAIAPVLTAFNPGITAADMLHLNLARAPNPFPAQGSNATLGALAASAGDPAGYPNGRRLADDVTDILLRVLAGTLSGNNVSPNNQLGDGVNVNDRPFSATFPYLARPFEGFAPGYHPVQPASAVR